MVEDFKKLMKNPLNCQARQIKRKPQFQSKAKENWTKTFFKNILGKKRWPSKKKQ